MVTDTVQTLAQKFPNVESCRLEEMIGKRDWKSHRRYWNPRTGSIHHNDEVSCSTREDETEDEKITKKMKAVANPRLMITVGWNTGREIRIPEPLHQPGFHGPCKLMVLFFVVMCDWVDQLPFISCASGWLYNPNPLGFTIKGGMTILKEFSDWHKWVRLATVPGLEPT